MEITCQEVCRKLIVLAFYNNSTWKQFLEALSLCMQQSLHSTTEPCIRLNIIMKFGCLLLRHT